MASIPPKNRLFISDQPKVWPMSVPIVIIKRMIETAVMIGPVPILTSFLKENSRPKANIKKTIPISAHVWMLDVSLTDGKNVICGLAKKPARM